MGKVLFGVIAVLASMMLVDSLTCNSCSFGLFCSLIGSTETCSTNTSVCSTTKTTFSNLPSFGGFVFSGCASSNASCGTTNTMNLVRNYTYTVTTTCCTTDKCNTVSAAPSARMTLGAVVGAAALASLLGRML